MGVRFRKHVGLIVEDRAISLLQRELDWNRARSVVDLLLEAAVRQHRGPKERIQSRSNFRGNQKYARSFHVHLSNRLTIRYRESEVIHSGEESEATLSPQPL